MVSPAALAGIWTPGFWEILIVFLAVLIIFGPKSIPQLGRSLGRGMREFKNATSKFSEAMDDIDEEDGKPAKPTAKAPSQLDGDSAPRESVATGPQGARVKDNG